MPALAVGGGGEGGEDDQQSSQHRSAHAGHHKRASVADPSAWWGQAGEGQDRRAPRYASDEARNMPMGGQEELFDCTFDVKH